MHTKGVSTLLDLSMQRHEVLGKIDAQACNGVVIPSAYYTYPLMFGQTHMHSRYQKMTLLPAIGIGA